jgi:hypothetical protein
MAAAAMAVLAAVLYFGVTVPTRRQAAMTADAYGRARVERQEAMGRLAALQRRLEARGRAVSAATGAGADPATTTRAVRLAVSRVLESSRARGVQLGIRPGSEGVDVSIQARGAAHDVLRLAGELARPEVGVVLGSVQMVRAGDTVAVQIQGHGVAPP